MPMSRRPRSDWLGSSTSPPLITRSNLSSGPMTANADPPAVANAREAAPVRTGRRDASMYCPPDVPCAMRLSRRSDLDLDLLLRPLEQRFDTGASGCATGRHPGVPHFVHLVHGANIGKPDGGFQELRLVGAGLGEIGIDDRQDFRRLLGYPGRERLVGRKPGEVDGVAVNYGLAHTGTCLDTFNSHAVTSLLADQKGGVEMAADGTLAFCSA